jgi:hypothetical protein
MLVKTTFRRNLPAYFFGVFVAALWALPVNGSAACPERFREMSTTLALCNSSNADTFVTHYTTYETELDACRQTVISANDVLSDQCGAAIRKQVIVAKALALARGARFWAIAHHAQISGYRPALSEAKQAASLVAYANAMGGEKTALTDSVTKLLALEGVDVASASPALSPLTVGTSDEMRSDTVRSCVDGALAVNVFPDWGKLSCPQAAALAESGDFERLVRLWGTDPTHVAVTAFKALVLIAGGLTEKSVNEGLGERYMKQGISLAGTLPTGTSESQLGSALQPLVLKAQSEL